MKSLNFACATADSNSRSYICMLFVVVLLVCGVYFISGSFVGQQYNLRLTRWKVVETIPSTESRDCEGHCRLSGSETLPRGIVTKTSDLTMRPLWGGPTKYNKPKSGISLLALAVGIKQKEIVDQIVKKFLISEFVVMLFHYDGILDQWNDLPWSNQAIHVSAVNQTKWWFAKRFLHPDIVAEYDYIFLWDEDLGVANFDPKRYLSIVKEEGLEISQPALDPTKSAVYHPITARRPKLRVHRRMYKFSGGLRCYHNSTSPPCVGWVELMAPVFSREAWRCVWFMIQNDLIHAWGLDFQLGYCAKGDRMKNVGVVDSEYIVHLGLPTLGVFNQNGKPSDSHVFDNRAEVRKQSSIEMKIFQERWKVAEKEDKCWMDHFIQSSNQTHN